MNWENLTGDQFPKMVEKVEGVCLLPLSCIERHAHHLPTGTDMFIARAICERAAELEPAIVHPNFIFTQILEARHYPGTIAIDPLLTIQLLENVFREIARNGLKKIVIVNGHGGNDYLIHYLAQIQLASRREYVVYVSEPHYAGEEQKELAAQWESKVDGHAGERETSAILAVHPELVDKGALKSDTEGNPRERLKSLRDRGVDMGIWWYADHPTHYCGDGTKGTAEKGEKMLNIQARELARTIKLIKEDKETKRLQDEFFSKTNLPA